jgi:hypothetical protein
MSYEGAIMQASEKQRKQREPALLPCEFCQQWTEHSFAQLRERARDKDTADEMYKCSVFGRFRILGAVSTRRSRR